MSQSTYLFTKEELEDNYDYIKTIIANSIGHEFNLNFELVDEWCKTHTIILKKKNIFRTISDLWKDTKESKDLYITIVKN